ncbi:hypothetical protein NN561_011417 [Cricetulus griseus]
MVSSRLRRPARREPPPSSPAVYVRRASSHRAGPRKTGRPRTAAAAAPLPPCGGARGSAGTTASRATETAAEGHNSGDRRCARPEPRVRASALTTSRRPRVPPAALCARASLRFPLLIPTAPQPAWCYRADALCLLLVTSTPTCSLSSQPPAILRPSRRLPSSERAPVFSRTLPPLLLCPQKKLSILPVPQIALSH